MRILNVTATYLPSTNGVAVVVSSTKIELEKLGNDVTVLAPENRKCTKIEQGIIRYPSVPNPMIEDYPIPLFPDLPAIIKLMSGNKPDIVHTHHPFHVGYFARLIADYYKVPLAFTFHTRYDTQSEYTVNFLPNNLKKWFVQNNINEFCKKTDLIISPCNSVTKSLLKEMPEINVATIPTGASRIPRSKNSVATIRKKLGIPEGKKVLLTVSRLSAEKNLSLLIEGVALLDDNYILIIVGGGPSETELKQLAKETGCLEKIRFIGAVEHQSLGMYYQVADVFVYCSITETQGLIFLEALSFGLPIIAVRSDASEEWVSNKFGILANRTSEGLAKGISEIVGWDRFSLSEEMGNFVKRFTINKSTKLLLKEYGLAIKLYSNKK